MSASELLLPGLREDGMRRIRTRGGRILARYVSARTVRLRAPELDALGVGVRTPDADPTVLLTELSRGLLRAVAVRSRVQDRAEVLRHTVATATDAEAGFILARHLRVTTRRTLDRFMDLWAIRRGTLDIECVLEREDQALEALGARVEVACEAIGGLLESEPDAGVRFSRSGALGAVVKIAVHDLRRPSRLAAVRALVASVASAHRAGRAASASVLEVLRGLARDPDVWVARAALAVAVAGERDDEMLTARLLDAGTPDAFLIRARVLELWLGTGELPPGGTLDRCLGDRSELVRFTLASGLLPLLAGREGATAERMLRQLLAHDRSPQVRAWVAGSLSECGGVAQPLLPDALLDAGLVARHAIAACERLIGQGVTLNPDVCEALEGLSLDGDPAEAASAREVLSLIRAAGHPLAGLVDRLGGLPEGSTEIVRLPPGTVPEALAEALIPCALRGFGFWLEPLRGGCVRVTRGDSEGLRIWRLVHELMTPLPSKRQAYRHTLGRRDLGAIRVPPGRLDETSATVVPCQRVRSEQHGSWVPAVPLPDDGLHALERGRVRIVTAEGITTVDGPDGSVGRGAAWLRMVGQLGRLSRLRRESLESTTAIGKAAYEVALAELGVTVDRPRREEGSTLRSGIDILTYALGLGTNTTRHLAIAVGIMALLFYGRALVHLGRLRRDRSQIPLVIGGWGTRGKSGTERLKMGLMAGLGVPALGKTTGCEAMVLHSPGGRPTEDINLFRPFDKATIWEQLRVVRLARGLDVRVLLWECMALRPSYVDILQRRWMRDDLSTITNAYADHEDVMGPSGMDVARTIAGFTPERSCLITTEGPMRALLESEAARVGSVLRSPPLHHQELIPADLLARFPYREHPSNIALACGVAEALGVPRIEAIGWMAEHVVPDLGALAVYPSLEVAGREVTFVNGMSANDEISFRHSWRAGGMVEHDPADPLAWRVTVVNNRADRVPRSQVFARIMVEHAPAHRHVLIGTNLEGLRNYVEEALDEHVRRLPDDADPETCRAFLAPLCLAAPDVLCAALLRRSAASEAAGRELVSAVRVGLAEGGGPGAGTALPAAMRTLAARIESTSGLAGVADAVVEAAERWHRMEAAVAQGASESRRAYKELFLSSLVAVEDPKASADEIVDTCARVAPPGASVRVFGCQNIKGTGLSFAWQWVWWRQATAALTAMVDESGSERATALARLETVPVALAPACDAVAARLDVLFEDPELAPRARRLQLELSRRSAALDSARGRRSGGSLLSRILRPFERLLDPVDAVLRSRQARGTFEALAAGRVSHRGARETLELLTRRQKGGWIDGADGAEARSADLGVSDPDVLG